MIHYFNKSWAVPHSGAAGAAAPESGPPGRPGPPGATSSACARGAREIHLGEWREVQGKTCPIRRRKQAQRFRCGHLGGTASAVGYGARAK